MKRPYILLAIPFLGLAIMGADCNLDNGSDGGTGGQDGGTDGGVDGGPDGGVDGGDGGYVDGGDGGSLDGGDGGYLDGGSEGGVDGGDGGGYADGGSTDGGSTDGGYRDGGSTDGGYLDGALGANGHRAHGEIAATAYEHVLIERLDGQQGKGSLALVVLRKPDGTTYQVPIVDETADLGGLYAELPVGVSSGDELYALATDGSTAMRLAFSVSSARRIASFNYLGSVEHDRAGVSVP